MTERRWRFVLVVLVWLSILNAYGSSTPSSKDAKNLYVLDTFSTSSPLPNGIEVRSGQAVMRILALRDDVIRIRISRDGSLPEDASWATLSSARQNQVEVTAESDVGTVGFQTKLVRVRVNKENLRLSVSDLNGNILQEDAAGWPLEFHDKEFQIYKHMPADEHYFGLGDKVGPLDRRGLSFTLWNIDAYNFQESTDPIYKSIPFFLSVRAGRTLGVLLDNTWRSTFDFGKQTENVYSFGAENGAIDYYLLYGPDPKHVLNDYAWLTGLPPLPPLWSLGYQQSRYSYETESQLRSVADRLRKERIPADALYLDIDYQKQNRPFTVDTEKFPRFATMLQDLKKQNFHVVAITDLHIAAVPGAGYVPYDSGVAGDHFVKNPDGSIFVGQVWPGPSVFPDFTRQSTREWWGSLYKSLVSDGVSGFWNDMNEPSVFNTPNKTIPDDVQHRIDEPGFEKRTTTHREVHDMYGMENSRATYDGLLKISPDQRPFVLTRASYAGGQRYAATWTGDDSSTWNHLRLTTPMLLNLGLSGFGLAGADVGGFIGTPSPELLTRWMELGAFQPIDRNHSEKSAGHKEPWVHGPEQEGIRRHYIEERYKLMPYLYTTAEEMSRTGLPIMRPLFLEFPNATADGHPLDLDAGNEFLLGRSLLIAPAPFPERGDEYKVSLPAVRWYDYWTGQLTNKDASSSSAMVDTIPMRPALKDLPVFVREGSILPMQPLTQSTGEIPNGPLTVRVYPGKDCQGSLYQDDGNTMAYTHGEFLRLKFSCEQTPTSVKLQIGPHEGSYKPWWKELHVEVYGWNSSSSRVTGDNALVIKSALDNSRHVISFTVPDNVAGEHLEISSQH
ncbi:MAG: Alpha-glucosidase 2 [Acidobacteriaceae bacterium]|nr:Alpha-glucosidase 2 [Acidobacteriaceae bacterium]